MTFDEIQKIIEQMLAVQRELQESHLRFQESQQEQRQEQRQEHQSLRQEIEALVALQQNILAVQRDLQEDQITQRQEIQEHRLAYQQELQARHQAYHQEIQALLVAQHEQRVLLDRLIGYSLTNESDHLDLHERMDRLEERMRRIRGNGNGG